MSFGYADDYCNAKATSDRSVTSTKVHMYIDTPARCSACAVHAGVELAGEVADVAGHIFHSAQTGREAEINKQMRSELECVQILTQVHHNLVSAMQVLSWQAKWLMWQARSFTAPELGRMLTSAGRCALIWSACPC